MPSIILFVSFFSIFLFGSGLYFGSRLTKPTNNYTEDFVNIERIKSDKSRSEK
jgi:hypothetical protein